MRIKDKLKILLPALPVLLSMALFLAFPARYTESVREGVSLWAVAVLPATFPFLFLTALFTKLKLYRGFSRAVSPLAGKLFRVSGAGGCAAVLSALSGYPVGARTVYDLKRLGLIREEEVFRLSCLSTTTGPMFLVGAVGAGMYKCSAAGWVLLASHLAAVWLTCFVLRFTGKRASLSPPTLPKGKLDIYEILMGSVLSVLCVGGSIALFYAFGQMLSDIGAFAHITDMPMLEGVLRGLLEMTSGCSLLAREFSPLSLALSCFLVTFGGACVLMQQLVYLSGAGVKVLPFLFMKCVQGVLAALISYALAFFIF